MPQNAEISSTPVSRDHLELEIVTPELQDQMKKTKKQTSPSSTRCCNNISGVSGFWKSIAVTSTLVLYIIVCAIVFNSIENGELHNSSCESNAFK